MEAAPWSMCCSCCFPYQYFLEVPFTVIRAVPSKAELARLEEAKKRRIKERKEKLGPQGLKEWGEIVKNATAANKVG